MTIADAEIAVMGVFCRLYRLICAYIFIYHHLLAVIIPIIAIHHQYHTRGEREHANAISGSRAECH